MKKILILIFTFLPIFIFAQIKDFRAYYENSGYSHRYIFETTFDNGLVVKDYFYDYAERSLIKKDVDAVFNIVCEEACNIIDGNFSAVYVIKEDLYKCELVMKKLAAIR